MVAKMLGHKAVLCTGAQKTSCNSLLSADKLLDTIQHILAVLNLLLSDCTHVVLTNVSI